RTNLRQLVRSGFGPGSRPTSAHPAATGDLWPIHRNWRSVRPDELVGRRPSTAVWIYGLTLELDLGRINDGRGERRINNFRCADGMRARQPPDPSASLSAGGGAPVIWGLRSGNQYRAEFSGIGDGGDRVQSFRADGAHRHRSIVA